MHKCGLLYKQPVLLKEVSLFSCHSSNYQFKYMVITSNSYVIRYFFSFV